MGAAKARVLERLISGEDGVAVLDGGLATELENRGADLTDSLWSAKCLLENPGLIRQVHLDYFRAGADIVTSCSYQVSGQCYLYVSVPCFCMCRCSLFLGDLVRQDFSNINRAACQLLYM
jgi:hypothetical protein